MFRIVTSVIVCLVGLCFLFFALSTSFIFLIHSGITLAIGAAILLNKHEDDIEEINEPKDK